MPVQDPLFNFGAESRVVYAISAQNPLADVQVDSPERVVASESWPEAVVLTQGTDTTSRVISFVLGFALATLVAWLGSIASNDASTPPIEQRVAATVTPVVTAATQEKTSATTEDGEAAVSVVAAPPVRAATRPERIPAAPLPALPDVKGGTLVLSSSPEGAQVVLDGQVMGETPVMLSDLPAGSRVLVMRREGYSRWSASVRIVANQLTTVQAMLAPAATTGG